MPTTTDVKSRDTRDKKTSFGIQTPVCRQLWPYRGVSISKHTHGRGTADTIKMLQLKYVHYPPGVTGNLSGSSSEDKYPEDSSSETESRGDITSTQTTSTTRSDRSLDTHHFLPVISHKEGHVTQWLPRVALYQKSNKTNNKINTGNMNAFKILRTRATSDHSLLPEACNRSFAYPVISDQRHRNHVQLTTRGVNVLKNCSHRVAPAGSSPSLNVSTSQSWNVSNSHSSILNQTVQNGKPAVRISSQVETMDGKHSLPQDVSNCCSSVSGDAGGAPHVHQESPGRARVLCPPSESVEHLRQFVEGDIVGANNVAVTIFGPTRRKYSSSQRCEGEGIRGGPG